MLGTDYQPKCGDEGVHQWEAFSPTPNPVTGLGPANERLISSHVCLACGMRKEHRIPLEHVKDEFYSYKPASKESESIRHERG